MKKLNKLMVVMFLVITGLFLVGCQPFDVPEFKDISTSQTAFLVPLVGDTSQQNVFKSEELLSKSEVATKRVQIPHIWVATGLQDWQGQYLPSMTLIIVERQPETREWTDAQTTGTSVKNEGIVAESKESIAFMAKMNATAQIDVADAVHFLFRYNNKPLSDIMDTEIRARIETVFVEQCATYSLDDLLLNKTAIMKAIRDDVIPYFKDRGITITNIGLKGDLTYLNPDIQKSIDAKFQSAQNIITQGNDNQVILSKAKANADAQILAAQGIAESNRKISESLSENVISYMWIQKWNGVQPLYMGNGQSILNLPAIAK